MTNAATLYAASRREDVLSDVGNCLQTRSETIQNNQWVESKPNCLGRHWRCSNGPRQVFIVFHPDKLYLRYFKKNQTLAWKKHYGPTFFNKKKVTCLLPIVFTVVMPRVDSDVREFNQLRFSSGLREVRVDKLMEVELNDTRRRITRQLDWALT